MIFFTKRLYIRNYKKEDAEDCFKNWGQDKETGKYVYNYPIEDLDRMKTLVEEFSENGNCWVICLENDIPIGTIIFKCLDLASDILEVGYIIGKKYQRRGYAKEALVCMLNHYFMNKDIYLVQALCNRNNIASIGLLKGIGFKEDGVLRKRFVNSGPEERDDCIVYSITYDEFCSNSGNNI